MSTVNRTTTQSDGTTSSDALPVADEAVVLDTLRSAALNAFAGNRTYTGLASPTAAQTTSQVKALSQQMNGVIRLLLGQLDGTN